MYLKNKVEFLILLFIYLDFIQALKLMNKFKICVSALVKLVP